VVNYPDPGFAFTRIHEFRHLHPERNYQRDRSVIFRECSRFATRDDEPYYPINRAAGKISYDTYRSLAAAEPNVILAAVWVRIAIWTCIRRSARRCGSINIDCCRGFATDAN
jgi:UDP-galactopyranose mutase